MEELLTTQKHEHALLLEALGQAQSESSEASKERDEALQQVEAMAAEIRRMAALVERYEGEFKASRDQELRQSRIVEEEAAGQLLEMEREVRRLLNLVAQYEEDHATDLATWEVSHIYAI